MILLHRPRGTFDMHSSAVPTREGVPRSGSDSTEPGEDYYLLNRVKVTTGPSIPRAAHDSAMVPAAARPLPLVPCKSWSHEHAALWNGS